MSTKQRRRSQADARRQSAGNASSAAALAGGRSAGVPQRRRSATPGAAVAVPEVIAPLSFEARLIAIRLDLLIAVGLIAVAILAYQFRLTFHTEYIYDEVYHAYTAAQYAIGNNDAWVWYTQVPKQGVAYEWTHPPLGKLIIQIGIELFGDTPLGWRAMSVLFGALGIALIYWLAYAITKKRWVGLLAAGFLLIDGLYFVQSRIGTLDIFGAVFMLAAFTAFYFFLTAPSTRVAIPLVLTGLGMGLGMANKWNAVYPSAVIGLVAVWRTFWLFINTDKRQVSGETRRARIQHLIWVPVGLIVMPLLVYLASYIPFFLAKHTWSELVELHRQMYYYHSHLKATHDFQSSWWQWPLNWRPVWYGIKDAGAGLQGRTYANGNTALFWSFLFAVPYITAIWWKRRNPALAVIMVGFFAQWLPWALVPRIAYAYHFLPAAVIGVLAVALAVAELWERQRDQRLWRWVAGSWTAVILACFVFLYPVFTSWPLTQDELQVRYYVLCPGATVIDRPSNPCAVKSR